MEKVKIGIIGVNGKYGKWLKSFFETQNCEVVGSDSALSGGHSLENVVEVSQVIVFSVPIDKAVDVVLETIPFSREDQLWLDVTSIKEPVVEAMLKSKAEVVGMHPMCAPPQQATLAGQTLVVCPARISKWSDWLERIIKATQAKVKVSLPKEHDKYMAVVQGLPHAFSLVMSSVIRELGLDPDEIMDYTSPFYRIALSLMGRILSQESELYANIQFCNPNISTMLDLLEKEVKSFHKIVGKKEKENFVDSFNANKNYFGRNNLNDADSLFKNLIDYIAKKSINTD